MEFLPKPRVVRCLFESGGEARLAAMELHWDVNAPGTGDRAWHLPLGISVHSPAPTRFGIAVERTGDDAYRVQLLWNRVQFSWTALTRVQIMTSSLSLILQALGSDMWHLLHQPVQQSLAA